MKLTRLTQADGIKFAFALTENNLFWLFYRRSLINDYIDFRLESFWIRVNLSLCITWLQFQRGTDFDFMLTESYVEKNKSTLTGKGI